MATTGPDTPLPPAEAVAVFDRFKANLAHVAGVPKERLDALEAAEMIPKREPKAGTGV